MSDGSGMNERDQLKALAAENAALRIRLAEATEVASMHEPGVGCRALKARAEAAEAQLAQAREALREVEANLHAASAREDARHFGPISTQVCGIHKNRYLRWRWVALEQGDEDAIEDAVFPPSPTKGKFVGRTTKEDG